MIQIGNKLKEQACSFGNQMVFDSEKEPVHEIHLFINYITQVTKK